MNVHPRHTHLSVTEAAKLVGVTREAILIAINKGQLTTIKTPGRTGQHWIDIDSFRALYPGRKRRKAGRPSFRQMTTEEAHAFLGNDVVIASDPEERAAARKRARGSTR